MKKQKGEAITAFAIVLFSAVVWLAGLASSNYTKAQELEAVKAQAPAAAEQTASLNK